MLTNVWRGPREILVLVVDSKAVTQAPGKYDWLATLREGLCLMSAFSDVLVFTSELETSRMHCNILS